MTFLRNPHPSLASSWSMIFSENRYPPIARRKTRVNALMIKSGAGFFGIMLSCACARRCKLSGVKTAGKETGAQSCRELSPLIPEVFGAAPHAFPPRRRAPRCLHASTTDRAPAVAPCASEFVGRLLYWRHIPRVARYGLRERSVFGDRRRRAAAEIDRQDTRRAKRARIARRRGIILHLHYSDTDAARDLRSRAGFL